MFFFMTRGISLPILEEIADKQRVFLRSQREEELEEEEEEEETEFASVAGSLP